MRASQRGVDRGPIDEALKAAGLRREIVASVDGYIAALALARRSDLIASVPERHTCALRDGMFSFPFPVHVPEVTVSLFWHPRQDGDLAHQMAAPVRAGCLQGPAWRKLVGLVVALTRPSGNGPLVDVLK